MLSWLLYALIGRILVFVWQKFPDRYVPTQFIKDIHLCDLCSGVYIYTALAFVFDGADLLHLLEIPFSLIIASQIITGVVTAFVVHVFSKGLKSMVSPDTLIIK